eukprot:2455538-Pyramimonas_sp.AAC.1
MQHCEVCRNRMRVMNRPLVKGTLATYFNQRVQSDLFFLFEKVWLLCIDECVRFRLAGRLNSKTPADVLKGY